MKFKHLIWGNRQEDIRAEYEWHKKDKFDSISENMGRKPTSAEDVYSYIHKDLEDTFKCERGNLDKELDGRVVMFAEIGTWCGTRLGHRIMGNNLNQILDSYVAGASGFAVGIYGNKVLGVEEHHDGTNFYEYRVIREGVSMKGLKKMLDDMYNNLPVDRARINRYTRSLVPDVKAVYGW